MSESPSLGASKAFRIDSVVAMTSWSGPAAATRPRFEATLRSEEVAAGSVSQVDVRRTLASPAMERNPRACEFYM